MPKIGALNVDLSLETARFHKSIKNAEQNVGKMQRTMGQAAKAIGAAFAGIAVVDLANNFREMSKAAIGAAGDLGEQAAALGISTTALQEYRYAATQVALTNQDVDTLFQQLTRRTGDAAAGVKESAAAFEKLGVSIRDANGNVRNAADLMPEIADGLNRIPSEAERAAIVVDLFGRSGQKAAALLQGGSQGIADYADAAHRLGTVLSEEEIANADKVADKLAALNYQIEAQQNKKLLENADAILQFESSLADLKLGAIDAFNGINKGWADLDAALQRNRLIEPEFWTNAGRNIMALDAQISPFINSIPDRMSAMATGAIQAVSRMVNSIQSWVVGKLNAVWSSVGSKIQWVADKFKWLDDVVVRHSYVPDMVDSIGDHMARLDKLMVDPATAATQTVAEKFRALGVEINDLMRRLLPNYAAAQDLRNDLAKIDEGTKPGPNGEAPPLTEDMASELRFRAKGGGRKMAVSKGLLEAGETPLVEGLNKADDALRPLIDSSERWQAVIATLGGSFGGIAGQIADMVANVVNPAIQSGIDKVGQLQNAMQGLTSILQSIFGKKAGGIIGGVLQLGAAFFGGGGKIPGFANGTNFAPGGLALVGERGPELVNLPRGSQVFNNRELGQMGGGKLQVEVIANNDGFGAIVRNHAGEVVAQAAPALMEGAAQVAQARMRHGATRALTPGGVTG